MPRDWTRASDQPFSVSSGPPARFLATMSHELRTPLNVVIGFSEAIMRGGDAAMPAAQVAEYAGAINEAGRQLLSLIDVILDVARAETGDNLPSDLMEVSHLVAGAVAQAAESAEAAEIALHSETPPGLPLLQGDERRVRQALAHLVSNAIKFTPGRGAVRVSARTEPRTNDLLLMVSDTGIGIADGDLQRAFEPFVQLDSGNARRFSGSGLGLYVSRVTARAHGGDLILSSRPAVGTTAILRMPASRLVKPPAHLRA